MKNEKVHNNVLVCLCCDTILNYIYFSLKFFFFKSVVCLDMLHLGQRKYCMRFLRFTPIEATETIDTSEHFIY